MNIEKEWALECGRILKKVAPIIGITISELEDSFSQEISKITGTDISKEQIHKLLCGKQWPYYYIGIQESTEAILQIAKTTMKKHTDGDFEKKLHEIKKIVSLAFADFDHLSYFYSDIIKSNTHLRTTDLVERIMNNLSKFKDNEFLYLLNKYLDAFLSISFLEIDILTLNIKYELDCEIPVSIQNGYKLIADPVLQQWLALRNNNHKDALRKADEPQFRKMQNRLKDQLDKTGFEYLLPLTCFIEEYLLEEKNGVWSSVAKEDIDKILISKYIFGLNEDYWLELRSRVLDIKMKQSMDISDNCISLDLDRCSGVVWIDFQS